MPNRHLTPKQRSAVQRWAVSINAHIVAIRDMHRALAGLPLQHATDACAGVEAIALLAAAATALDDAETMLGDYLESEDGGVIVDSEATCH